MKNLSQLTLFGNNVPNENIYSKDKYVITKINKEITSALSKISLWNLNHFLIIVGPKHSGKTHLAHFFAEINRGIVINNINCEIIYDKEIITSINCIAIDDIEDFEDIVLFHTINFLKTQKIYVLLTCSTIQHFTLIDLKSRLISIPQLHIKEPDKTLADSVFCKILSDYDIQLEDKMISYIQSKLEPLYTSINQVINQLRETIFIRKEKITLSRIKQLI